LRRRSLPLSAPYGAAEQAAMTSLSVQPGGVT
jgi:hypothetical protein